MLHLFVLISKFVLIIFMLSYSYECFHVFRITDDSEKQQGIYTTQRIMIFLIHLLSFLVLFLTSMETQFIGLYLLQVIFLIAIFMLYRLFYKECSNLVLNNMCMLLTVGFIILARLSYDKALRQFFFCLAGLFICVLLPILLQSISIFRKLTWIYAIVGIIGLIVVFVFGAVSYGAKLNITIGGFTIQPSEFVKILFVFFVASMLHERADFKQLIITSVISAVFVLCLVASKDLGGAFLYFITFLVIVYVSTGKLIYFISGSFLMAVGGTLGYLAFTHVQNRVLAWLNPLAVYEKEGYQVSQSLFGIGTGGWFGLGLNQGLPKKIPVVEKDFVFSAISEEMGGLFCLCIILIYISCFIMFMNIAMKMKDPFYKLVALGLSVIFVTQVFLTIGGAIKFIPSTGVTLPLISYGGSSLLSTFLIFGIIQGLYMRNIKEYEDELEIDGKKRKEKEKERAISK